MSHLPQIEHFTEPEPAHSFAQFADLGLLWALNRYALMPRGYAVALIYADGDPQPSGWQIVSNFAEGAPFQFAPDVDEQQARAFELLLSTCSEHGQLPPLDAEAVEP